MKAHWAGAYSDVYGHEQITINIDGLTLSTELRGVTFTGDPDALAPATGLPPDAPFPLHLGTLCSCTLQWHMPVSIISPSGQTTAELSCQLVLGDPAPSGGLDREDLTLALRYREVHVRTSRAHDDFESALADIQRQLPPGLTLKVCISCAFSDYSPAGNGLFGGLACFRGNKEAYLAVSSKREMFQVWDTRTEFVPEIYLCPSYQQRGTHAGYRGGFPDP
jgi:hypothetical protein